MQKNHWPLRIFLLIAPWILAEILSGNTPIFKLMNPVDLLMLILAYGVPITLIWEYKVKYSLSFFWVFVLGIAYGIFNEWIMAKTILDTSTVPLWWFQNTSDFFWINWSWSLMILPWHAFFSVLFPIAIAHVLFPEEKTTSILGKKWIVVFLGISTIVLPVMAIWWQWSISPWLYIVFYGLILLLISLAWVVNRYRFREKEGKGIVWWLSMVIMYLFFFIFAWKLPFFFYALIGVILLCIFFWKFFILSPWEQSRFALGGYLSFGSFATLATLANGRYDLLVMYLLLVGGLFLLLQRKKP